MQAKKSNNNIQAAPPEVWEVASLNKVAQLKQWMVQLWWIPCLIAIVYILAIFGIQTYMSNKRKPFDLRVNLALWALFFSAFHALGAARTIPAVVSIFNSKGYHHLLCFDSRITWFTNSPAGVWTFLYCVLRVVTLFETLFVVLRKKELIVYHWYEHFTSLLVFWLCFATSCQAIVTVVSLQYFSNTIVYAYSLLSVLGFRPSSCKPFVTLLQVGTCGVNSLIFAYITLDKFVFNPVKEFNPSFSVPKFALSPEEASGGHCKVTSGAALAGCFFFASYLLFSIQYFFEKYA